MDFPVSGGLTVAYMSKLFVAVFVEKNCNAEVQESYDGKKAYMKPASATVLVLSAVIVPALGMLPYMTMDTLADMAQSFLGVHHAGHAVHYFTWVNLKGSLISIAIGAALYLIVVRRWMMVEQAYVDCWPKWIDLEEKFYRPLILKMLPGFFGGLCGFLDKGPDVLIAFLRKTGMVIAGTLNILTDGVVVLLRKTVYRDSPEQGELEEGNALTHTIGVFLNLLEELLNRTIWYNHEHRKDLEHWFVLKYTSFKENATVIGRSLSYGLVLFCLGLCATLIYLLVSAFL